MVTPLQSAIGFFQDFGIFDVVLPFLLVFTIMFAILEKTMILGSEGNDGKTPKKNLDSMVAFVVALLVVATNKVVTAINDALPNIVLLIVIVLMFLIMVGMFHKTGEMDFMSKHKGWAIFLIVITFIAIVLVFLGAIRMDSGETVLGYTLDYIIENFGGVLFTSIVVIVMFVLALALITRGPKKTEG